MKILVVEDEYLIALVLTEVLTDAGHTVIGPAASVEQALALCKGNPPDLALIDIQLQGSKTGLDLARDLHQWWGRLVIFTTAQPDRAYSAKPYALGIMFKPYSPNMIIDAVSFFNEVKQSGIPSKAPYGLMVFE